MSRTRSELGARLHGARKHAKMSLADASKALAVSKSTLSEAENTGLSFRKVVQAAELYRVRPEWLADGTGAMAVHGQMTAEALSLAAAIDAISNQSAREAALHLCREVVAKLSRLP